MHRRHFLQIAGFGIISSICGCKHSVRSNSRYNPVNSQKPNLIFIFADQLRAQSLGYAADPNAITPNIDKLAAESIEFTNAVSCCPVCSPFRASLMTGKYPLSHGVFLNDIPLNNDAVSIAQAYKSAGYKTGYIGKWHLNGYDRNAYIPPVRRQGFEFWKAFECTHEYNNSFYYAQDDTKLRWEGYDTFAQTKAADDFIQIFGDNPFALFLSWGPPHDPYDTAPAEYKNMFDENKIILRPNVPKKYHSQAKKDIAGYYAHLAAIDKCIGTITKTLEEKGLASNTILIFTSDHGDMLYSHGWQGKQLPFDESIKVPFLMRYPKLFGRQNRKYDTPFNTPDIMPTLLGLSGIEIPDTVEGTDFSEDIKNRKSAADNHAALILHPCPFGPFAKHLGGREWRGIRTKRYTYVTDLNGPWLLYDNENDPYQLENLCNQNKHIALRQKLDKTLRKKLKETNDRFLSGEEYIKKWGYKVDSQHGHPLDENGNPPWK